MVASALLVIVWLACTGFAVSSLRWLHRMRKLSDVPGTVVGREERFTGRSPWAYPVVEFTTRDGIQIQRTFHQLTRPRIGRKVRIVYDPSTLPEGRPRGTRSGLTGFLVTRPPLIYSVWLLLLLWWMVASGFVFLTLGIALLVARPP